MRTRLCGLLFPFLLAASASLALAQEPTDGLTEQQRLGRRTLAQSCGVCHLQPARGARTYGPPLSKGTAGGNDSAVRVIIAEGTSRMPAFKYSLAPAQIDAIVAFIRTVPVPTPVPAASR